MECAVGISVQDFGLRRRFNRSKRPEIWRHVQEGLLTAGGGKHLHPVYDRCDLRSLHRLIRSEGSIRIPLEIPLPYHCCDGAFRPVSGDIRETGGIGLGRDIQGFGQDGAEFCSGDGPIGLEGAVRVTRDDILGYHVQDDLLGPMAVEIAQFPGRGSGGRRGDSLGLAVGIRSD